MVFTLQDKHTNRCRKPMLFPRELADHPSGLNGEALGSCRAMNHTYVAEIGQQDPSKKCHELHSFQSGHLFCEKKPNDNPMNPLKGQSLLGLTTLIWCLLLYRSIGGQFSLGGCSKMSIPRTSKCPGKQNGKDPKQIGLVLAILLHFNDPNISQPLQWSISPSTRRVLKDH